VKNSQHIFTWSAMTLLAATLLAGCYTFKNASIPPNASFFYTEMFRNASSLAPPTYAQDFTNALRNKIVTESKLSFNEVTPDYTFKGTVVGYEVTPESPQADGRSILNRLTITVEVDFTNHLDEETSWKRRFSQFSNFGANQNLLDVQDALVEEINRLLVDEIFNASFATW
jgi:hypothetical protein